MNRKLTELEAPALAGVVKEKTVQGAIAGIANCYYDGATMIDLHLPHLESSEVEDLQKIVKASRLPILALNYARPKEDDDPAEVEERRVASLLRAVEAGAAGIDVQGYTFDQRSRTGYCGDRSLSFADKEPKEVVTDGAVIDKQCDLIERVHAMGAEVLLSCHPAIFMTAEETVELALFLEKRKPDIIKLVTAGVDTEEQMLESFRAMILLKKELKTKVSCHANGKMGRLSRIVNPILGGQIAFCVDRFDERSIMSQLDLRTARTAVDALKKLM